MSLPTQEESFNIILKYLKSNHEALKLLWRKIDLLEKDLYQGRELNSKKELKKKKIILSGEEKNKRRERWNKMIKEAREKYPNAWKSWKESDDKKLLSLHSEKKNSEEIAKILGRNPNSIKMRLENKHNIIAD